jgi:aspartyl-tRNA(Asn)/glutamyl-tRNA(Gln) amidotransferase subunit A
MLLLSGRVNQTTNPWLVETIHQAAFSTSLNGLILMYQGGMAEFRQATGGAVNDSHSLSIAELRSAFAGGKLTPSEHLAFIIDRIERLNPRLHAFVALDRERAATDAAECDRRYLEDAQRPLEGIPVAVKANIAVQGLENNAGLAARHGMIADTDAAIVTRLRAAGAIILGTLNMDEAAFSAATDNPFFGRCLNPHGEGLSPGGSSGGAASAIAAGLCSAAIGTDTLGSIRIPSAYCGVFGLKPTHGVGAMAGIIPLDPALDTVGPITRSMEDLTFLSNVLFAPDLASAMQRSRYLTLVDMGGVTAAPEIEAAFQFALTQLREPPAPLALEDDCARIALAAYATAGHALIPQLVGLGAERCAAFSPELIAGIEFVMQRGESDLLEDSAILASTRATLRSAIGNNGVILMPTVPHTAFRQGEAAPRDQAHWTALANVAGLPAISIPLGRTASGIPFGLQLMGPPGGEALLTAQARMLNDMLKAYAPPTNWW